MLSAETENKMMKKWWFYQRKLESMTKSDDVADDIWADRFIKLSDNQASIIDDIYIKKYGIERYNRLMQELDHAVR